jgi:hypothetical protein
VLYRLSVTSRPAEIHAGKRGWNHLLNHLLNHVLNQAWNQVSLEILMVGNFDEKSFALAAILTATWRATAL